MTRNNKTAVMLLSIALLFATSAPLVYGTSAISVSTTDSAGAINQKIADASNGDTISFEPGTYNVNLEIIDKTGITIQSAEPANPAVIQPTASIKTGVDLWGTSSDDKDTAHKIISSDEITIKNMVFNMADVKLTGRTTGFMIVDSTGTINKSEIANLDNGDARVTMLIHIATSEDTTYTKDNRAQFTVSDSVISNSNRIGVFTSGFVDVTLTDNTVESKKFGYGFEISRLSVATITGNTFSNFDKIAENSGSSGISIQTTAYAPEQKAPITTLVTIKDNIFVGTGTDSGTGIFIGSPGVTSLMISPERAKSHYM